MVQLELLEVCNKNALVMLKTDINQLLLLLHTGHQYIYIQIFIYGFYVVKKINSVHINYNKSLKLKFQRYRRLRHFAVLVKDVCDT